MQKINDTGPVPFGRERQKFPDAACCDPGGVNAVDPSVQDRRSVVSQRGYLLLQEQLWRDMGVHRFNLRKPVVLMQNGGPTLLECLLQADLRHVRLGRKPDPTVLRRF